MKQTMKRKQNKSANRIVKNFWGLPVWRRRVKTGVAARFVPFLRLWGSWLVICFFLSFHPLNFWGGGVVKSFRHPSSNRKGDAGVCIFVGVEGLLSFVAVLSSPELNCCLIYDMRGVCRGSFLSAWRRQVRVFGIELKLYIKLYLMGFNSLYRLCLFFVSSWYKGHGFVQYGHTELSIDWVQNLLLIFYLLALLLNNDFHAGIAP